MRRPVSGIWKVPSGGVTPALAVTGAFFFLGALAGCILAAQVGGGAEESLRAYLSGFLAVAQDETLVAPAFFPLLWEAIRWPLFATLMGFTALGLIGIPILFSLRGFFLSFAIAAFVRMFGGSGCLLAFLVFGLSGLLTVPALFVLGVQGLLASRCLALSVSGQPRRAKPYGRLYWVRCALCAVALCVSVLLDYVVVPVILRAVSASFPG